MKLTLIALLGGSGGGTLEGLRDLVADVPGGESVTRRRRSHSDDILEGIHCDCR